MQAQKLPAKFKWLRSTLLIVLGFEAGGCIVGGSFLILKPDGSLMDKPVEIMHGAFLDFLIPGVILLGLGILNSLAFVSVLRRYVFDWFLAGLALGGLFIWFWVEIAILRELHWLHAMWGWPVLLGWVVVIPLIALRQDSILMRKAMLTCGIVSSLWYLAINIFVPIWYEGYSTVSLTVSELSAIDAPTRILWVLLVMPYPLIFAVFGWGVLNSAKENRLLKVTGSLIIAYSIFNFYWPPMHMREVISTGGGTMTDTLHITWAMITLIFMMLLMGFGAAALGKQFRIYTIITWVVFIVCGVLTFRESPGIKANLPTPWIGVWERINIGAFLLWVVVLAIILMRDEERPAIIKRNQ